MIGRARKGIKTKFEMKLYLGFYDMAAEPLEIPSVQVHAFQDKLVRKRISNQYLACCRSRTKVNSMSKINII